MRVLCIQLVTTLPFSLGTRARVTRMHAHLGRADCHKLYMCKSIRISH